MPQDKPAFRAPFFRDLYKTLLAISSGSVVASVTFVQNLPEKRSGGIFFTGFTLLTSSIILQLLIPLINVISAGFYWDSETNQSEEDSKQAHFWGKTAGGGNDIHQHSFHNS